MPSPETGNIPETPCLQAVEAADVADNALQGAMFWLFQSYSSGANATASGNIDRVDYGVVPSDSTWCIKSNHLHAAQGVSKCNFPYAPR